MAKQLDKLFKTCTNELVMFTIKGCTNCPKLQTILDTISVNLFKFDIIDLSDDIYENEYDYDELIYEICDCCGNNKQFPKLFFNGEYWGNYNDVKRQYEFDGLQCLLKKMGIDNGENLDF